MIKKFSIFNESKSKKNDEFKFSDEDLIDIFQDYQDLVNNCEFEIDRSKNRLSINVIHSPLVSLKSINSLQKDIEIKTSFINSVKRIKSLFDITPSFIEFENDGFALTFNTKEIKGVGIKHVSFEQIQNQVYPDSSVTCRSDNCVMYWHNNQYKIDEICDINVFNDRNEITIRKHGSYMIDNDIFNIKDIFEENPNGTDNMGLDEICPRFIPKGGTPRTAWTGPIYLNYKGIHPIIGFEIGFQMVESELYKNDKDLQKFWKKIDTSAYEDNLILICQK